jgi:hemolysin activation/secretion protein
LASYGAGVRLSLPYQVSLSGEVAVPLQELRRNEKDDPRFFFNLAKRF